MLDRTVEDRSNMLRLNMAMSSKNLMPKQKEYKPDLHCICIKRFPISGYGLEVMTIRMIILRTTCGSFNQPYH